MRKLLYALAAVGILAIVGVGFGVFFFMHTNREIAAYVNKAVVAITAAWNPDELMRRSTADFRRHTKEEDLQRLFDAARAALGPLVDYEGAKGSWNTFSPPRSGVTMTGVWTARARFQKGEADLVLSLQKMDGKFEIEGFRINSSTLMRYVKAPKI